jgi:hypothetical protein
VREVISTWHLSRRKEGRKIMNETHLADPAEDPYELPPCGMPQAHGNGCCTCEPDDDGWPGGGEEDDEAYLLWLEQQEHRCHATMIMGPRDDPYITQCHITDPGHYPATRHQAPHPMGERDDGVMVTWRGGGSAGGDALPYRDVQEGSWEPVLLAQGWQYGN